MGLIVHLCSTSLFDLSQLPYLVTATILTKGRLILCCSLLSCGNVFFLFVFGWDIELPMRNLRYDYVVGLVWAYAAV